MPEEPRLIHPAANGSTKPDAGTPEQKLRMCGFITCRTAHGVQHIRVSNIVTFGTAVNAPMDQNGRIVGKVTPELGKCAIVMADAGQAVVDHSTETVAQLIADFYK